MHTFLYPSSTTFINSQPALIDRNMGRDEVVEIEKIVPDNAVTALISGSTVDYFTSPIYISRTLIHFDVSSISASVSAGDIPFPSFNIKLYSIEANSIRDPYVIECYQVSKSWRDGVGKKYDEYPSTSGVTWRSRGDQYLGLWDNMGGDYYTQSVSTTTVTRKQDILLNVTNLIGDFFSGSVENNGFLFKLQDESSSLDYGKIRYFSMNTNTVYSPFLDVSWDDSIYTVASSSIMDTNVQDYSVICKNLKPRYNNNELVRMNLGVRPKYAKKTFQKWPEQTYPYNDYANLIVLPKTSYFSIIDASTKEYILNYDDFTKISSTDSGSYFFVDFNAFPKERYYKILVKVVEENGNVNIYDTDIPFKISDA